MAATEQSTRQKAYFKSGGERCAAWHYPGRNGACVVMAAGLAVTKEPGTDPFAARFNKAGFSVLAFDFRRLGESGGDPRQVARIGEQQADFMAAVEFARTLPEVDPSRVAIWGFSLSGGHVFPVAARMPDLGAAIAVSALADGPSCSAECAAPHDAALGVAAERPRSDGRARRPVRPRPAACALTGERGDVAAITTPDSRNGPAALDPDGRYTDWQQAVAARSAMRLGFYRPARHASRVRCPLLVVAPEQDGVAPPEPLIRAGERAPRGEVVRIPGGHYAPFTGGHELAVEAQLAFLRRHLVAG